MSRRKLEALRALAERPGTEEEGIVARQMLARLEAKQEIPDDERLPWAAFEDMLRGEMSTSDFVEKLGRWHKARRHDPLPTEWKCACGATLPIGAKCENVIGHLAIQDAIREKFKPGDRVYYNKWAYTANCAGVVAAYVKLKAPNGNYPWAWLSVRFDYLKSARQIPIYSLKGWHLSHEPIERATLIQTNLREGMDRIEGLGLESV